MGNHHLIIVRWKSTDDDDEITQSINNIADKLNLDLLDDRTLAPVCPPKMEQVVYEITDVFCTKSLLKEKLNDLREEILIVNDEIPKFKVFYECVSA